MSVLYLDNDLKKDFRFIVKKIKGRFRFTYFGKIEKLHLKTIKVSCERAIIAIDKLLLDDNNFIN